MCKWKKLRLNVAHSLLSIYACDPSYETGNTLLFIQINQCECTLAGSMKLSVASLCHISLFLLILSFSTPDPTPYKGKSTVCFSNFHLKPGECSPLLMDLGVWMKDMLLFPILSAALFICGLWSSWQRIIVHWHSVSKENKDCSSPGYVWRQNFKNQ